MTKLTSDKYFLDTNILIYAYSDTDGHKQQLAQNLLLSQQACISAQVCKEFANVATRKLKHDWRTVRALIAAFGEGIHIQLITVETILAACDIAERYRYSFYDSLILSAALACGCTSLYSEDMQAGQLIENKLRIVNPFVEK